MFTGNFLHHKYIYFYGNQYTFYADNIGITLILDMIELKFHLTAASNIAK